MEHTGELSDSMRSVTYRSTTHPDLDALVDIHLKVGPLPATPPRAKTISLPTTPRGSPAGTLNITSPLPEPARTRYENFNNNNGHIRIHGAIKKPQNIAEVIKQLKNEKKDAGIENTSASKVNQTETQGNNENSQDICAEDQNVACTGKSQDIPGKDQDRTENITASQDEPENDTPSQDEPENDSRSQNEPENDTSSQDEAMHNTGNQDEPENDANYDAQSDCTDNLCDADEDTVAVMAEYLKLTQEDADEEAVIVASISDEDADAVY